MWINHILWSNKTSGFINRHLKAMDYNLDPSQRKIFVNRSSAGSPEHRASSINLSLGFKWYKMACLVGFGTPCSIIYISSYDLGHRLQSPQSTKLI